jgi:transposase
MATLVDELGRMIAGREFPNTLTGHSRALEWMTPDHDIDVVGIEGSGNYGAGFARALIEAGMTVKEVPAFVTARERKRAPSRGKSDPADALAIARATLRGEGLCEPMHDGPYADLKLLVDDRDQLIRARQRIVNKAHSLLARTFPGYEATVGKLTTKKGLRAARAVIAGTTSIAAELIAVHLTDIESLSARITAGERRIEVAVAATGTSLTSQKGIGALTAAKILGEVNDPRRLKSEAAFAMLNGTAPLPASSGTTIRHRLNRGGNRQLNRAVHMMAMTLRRCDDETQTYINRRIAEGKTKREAMRALKRHLSDVVYRCLMADCLVVSEAA